MIATRLAALQNALSIGEAYLISNPSDVLYFTGFESLVAGEREGFCLVTKNSTLLIHASFSPLPHNNQLEAKAGCYPKQLAQHLTEYAKKFEFKNVYVDADDIRLSEYTALEEVTTIQLHRFDKQILWRIRMIKDSDEVSLLKKAATISQQALKQSLPFLKPGITELEFKRQLENDCYILGATAMAFPTIIAFGPHAALPHHQPDNTVLESETAVLIDFGAQFQHYCADMTRTVWVGSQPSAQFTTIEKIIFTAYKAALASVTTSIKPTAKEVDTAARSVIQEAGYEKEFIHTTGHGVGLDIHEPPSLHWNNNEPLKTNMAITIEPGIYIVNKIGYRYENTVLLTEAGAEEITLI